MNDVTRILSAIESGDENASGKVLPLVYQEFRRLAPTKLSSQELGQTLQPTMLVHEAYLRLVDVARSQLRNGRGHFFWGCGRSYATFRDTAEINGLPRQMLAASGFGLGDLIMRVATSKTFLQR